MENVPKEESLTPQSLIKEEEVKKTLLADKGEKAQLISWKVVDFTKRGDNYACVVTSVEVKYSMDNQEQDVVYVVKLNPCRIIQNMDDFSVLIFEKESKFYLDLVPELNAALTGAGQDPLRFPQCFHSSLETDREQIYFEDLRAKGFKMFDRKKGMSKDHATLVLKELARLHAAAYLLQAKTPDEAVEVKYDFLLKDVFDLVGKSKEVWKSMFDSSLTTSAEMLKKVGANERAISWIESLKPRLEHIFSNGMKSKRFGTICHGDCWNNNILFRYNDENKPVDVILLDLQICRKASLATDLNYLLYTSLDGNVRGQNLSDFLTTYHTSYENVLKIGGFDMHFTEEELMKEFRDKNELGAIFAMMALPMLLMESDETPDLTGEVDIEEMMKEMKSKAMDMLDTNPLMKPRFVAIFDELMETGLIP